MQIRLLQKVRAITTSFWFIPSLFTLAGLVAAILALRLDMNIPVQQWSENNPVLFTSGEAARTLLATLAGSAISVAGVVFSITIVVLNMAAAQFGPGLLTKFMHHRGTQVVLGAFVATFTYCLIVMRFVDDEGGFVPHIAANFGLLLGLLSFFLLIYFIHHVSMFVQVARVIDDVASKMEHTLRKAFPERKTAEQDAPDEEVDDDLVQQMHEQGAAVSADSPGYLEAIDQQQLLKLAHAGDLLILLNYRPGHFVLPGSDLALVSPAERLDGKTAKSIRQCLAFGPERSLTQDPEFAVHQLVEIAMRSLSPSINDPFTALNCMDQLAAALTLLASRRLRSRYLRDDDAKIRVITNPLTYSGIVDAAFNQVRQMATGKAAVVFRLLELVAELGGRDLPESFRDALEGQLEAIRETNENLFKSVFDSDQFLARLRKAERSVARIAT